MLLREKRCCFSSMGHTSPDPPTPSYQSHGPALIRAAFFHGFRLTRCELFSASFFKGIFINHLSNFASASVLILGHDKHAQVRRSTLTVCRHLGLLPRKSPETAIRRDHANAYSMDFAGAPGRFTSTGSRVFVKSAVWPTYRIPPSGLRSTVTMRHHRRCIEPALAEPELCRLRIRVG
jgi:hypothetical protein